jgi:hypothetical protein
MATNISNKLSLTTDLDEEDYQTNNSIYETNSSSMAKIDEDIYTKQQELKVFIFVIINKQIVFIFRKKLKLLLLLVQKWLECVLKLNEKN